jgi:hypothetical protein
MLPQGPSPCHATARQAPSVEFGRDCMRRWPGRPAQCAPGLVDWARSFGAPTRWSPGSRRLNLPHRKPGQTTDPATGAARVGLGIRPGQRRLGRGYAMRCAVWTGGGDFRLEERRLPRRWVVRVRVHACGVCLMGSDRVCCPRRCRRRASSATSGAGRSRRSARTSPLSVGMAVAGTGTGAFMKRAIAPADRLFRLPTGVPLDAACFVSRWPAASRRSRPVGLPSA